MSRHDAAPTHGWLISSRINKWLALGFIVLMLAAFIAVFTITYSIRRDCRNYYKRNIKLAGYWLHITAGSTTDGCPQ